MDQVGPLPIVQGEGEQVPAAPAEEDSRESDHAGQGSDAEEPETIPSDTEEGVEGGAPEPKVQGEQANNEADESEARVEVQQEEEGQGDRAEAQKGQVGGRTEQVEAVNGEQSGGDGNHEQQEGEDEEENKNRKKKKKTKKKKNRPPSTEAPNEQRAPPSVDQRGQLVTDSDNAIMVTEVDIQGTARKVRSAFQKDTMRYLQTLGALDWQARPSVLQRRIKEGKNTIREALRPWLDDDGLYLSRFHVDDYNNIIPEPPVPQFRLELGSVKGVPKKVLLGRGDPPQLHLARAALYDINTKVFHGNVHAVLCSKTADKGATWTFSRAQQFICRSFVQSPGLHVYIEFNVSHELSPAEAAELPPTHRRASQQVDEVTVAWVLLPFHTSAVAEKEETRVLPLMCGSLLRAVPLAQQQRARHEKKGFFSKMTSRTVKPQVSLRVIPIRDAEAAHENLSLLPENVVTDIHSAMMMSCYRAVLAAQLARVPTYMAAICDPVVTAFPAIMDDPPLRVMMHRLWGTHFSALSPDLRRTILSSSHAKALDASPTEMHHLVRMFRQVVTMIWPMLHSQAIPPSSIMNFNAHQSLRMNKLSEMAQAHPVVTLSHNAYMWLHKPFDVAELAYSYSDDLGPSI